MSYSKQTWDTTSYVNPTRMNYIEQGIYDASPLVVSKSSVSSLPTTISNAAITDDMVCVNSTLSNPSAQLSDWTVTTSSGSVSISGTISGTTNITLYLSKSR